MVEYNIQQLQDKLLAYHAQGCPTEQEVYQMLGFAEWDDYHAVYNDIWTPEFRYRLYMLGNPHSTLEQAFLAGVRIGWMDGFDEGYNAALEDLDEGVAV
jgi:hypothetical protein